VYPPTTRQAGRTQKLTKKGLWRVQKNAAHRSHLPKRGFPCGKHFLFAFSTSPRRRHNRAHQSCAGQPHVARTGSTGIRESEFRVVRHQPIAPRRALLPTLARTVTAAQTHALNASPFDGGGQAGPRPLAACRRRPSCLARAGQRPHYATLANPLDRKQPTTGRGWHEKRRPQRNPLKKASIRRSPLRRRAPP